MLARWAQERLYERIQESRQGIPALCAARRPALCERPHSHRPCTEQDPERHHHQVEDDVRVSGAHVPGWDCHGLPIEHQVLKELGDKKRDLDALAIRKLCRGMPKSMWRFSGRSFSVWECWAIGNSPT